MVVLSSSLENEPIESERMAESVVERNAGDHDGFNLPRFAMSLVQLRSHQLDFPDRFMLIAHCGYGKVKIYAHCRLGD